MTGAIIRYQEQAHDGPRTMEQQTFLLAKAAKDVWAHWSEHGATVQNIDPIFDQRMRYLFTMISETDIFMGGVHHADKT